jgi:hypothetical protein
MFVSDSLSTTALLVALLLMGGISMGLFYLGSKLGQSRWQLVEAIGTVLRVVALGIAILALVTAFKLLWSFVVRLADLTLS